MTTRTRFVRLALGLLPALAPAGLLAQSATLRGAVTDEQGAPLAGVKLELEFKGESRVKVVKTVETDKKGRYLRAGLASGRWHLTFSKEGYDSFESETDVSMGGISDLPPVVMRSRAPAPAVQGLPSAADAGAAVVAELQATYTKALGALKEGRDAEAEALLKQVLEKAPLTGPAHFWLGQVYLARGDLTAAEAALRKSVELQPTEAKPVMALATALAAANRNDEALALLQGATASFGANADFQFELGVMSMNAGREAEAQAALARVLELSPEHVEAHYYLGTLAINRNDVAGAAALLQKYLSLAPENAPNAPLARQLLQTLKTRK